MFELLWKYSENKTMDILLLYLGQLWPPAPVIPACCQYGQEGPELEPSLPQGEKNKDEKVAGYICH